MLVSRLWLQKFFDDEPASTRGGEPTRGGLPDAPALAEALTFHAFEIDGIEKKGEDDVLDVKVTPNRGADCLSHRGIAKELSAILKLPLSHDPFAQKPNLEPRSSEVTVNIQDPVLCRRYIAGHVRGVTVGPSPAWLKERLEAIGQRSINNVVDATNFVMFNTGQPLHAFDAGKLGSLKLGVRTAKAGETLVALDKKKYELSDSMLVITADDMPVGIAGVKGGEPAAIDETTTDIVIESANFDGVSVRKTAQALKLRTDASSRFEQGLSPECAAHGMRNMMEFVAHITGGEVEGFVDVYPVPQQEARVSVSLAQVSQVLGIELTDAEVADVFTRLGFAYKPARPDDSGRSGGEEGGDFLVFVPSERTDITIAENLVEEVGRIVGYDRVPAIPLPPFARGVEENEGFTATQRIRAALTNEGYSEVYTSVFAEEGERAVLNKVDSVRPYLRASLLPGLTEALAKNIPNKDLLGLSEVKLFEIGTVWKGGAETVTVGTVSEKDKAQEWPLEEYVKTRALAHELAHEQKDVPRYKPFSKYPYIVRDVAVWTPAETDADALKADMEKEAGELCVSVRLFDEFKKGDKTSYAFRLVFQSFERTLTEAEASDAMERVYAMLKAKGFEVR